MTADTASLVAMARDSHRLMLEHDTATKGNAAVRNAALVRLVEVYGMGVPELARLTGVRDGAIRNVLFKARANAAR